jgi:hypothetical protein
MLMTNDDFPSGLWRELLRFNAEKECLAFDRKPPRRSSWQKLCQFVITGFCGASMQASLLRLSGSTTQTSAEEKTSDQMCS